MKELRCSFLLTGLLVLTFITYFAFVAGPNVQFSWEIYWALFVLLLTVFIIDYLGCVVRKCR